MTLVLVGAAAPAAGMAAARHAAVSCYRFTADEIDALEAATSELYAQRLDGPEHVVARRRVGEFAILRPTDALRGLS